MFGMGNLLISLSAILEGTMGDPRVRFCQQPIVEP